MVEHFHDTFSPAAKRALNQATRECETGKIGYRTKRKARIALEAFRSADTMGYAGRYVYHCRLCDAWHLTKQPPRHPQH